MKIYYFVHIVGRDQGNSGIPRVSRNLGRALDETPGVTLVPVRWDAASSALVHAETPFLDTMSLYEGPRLTSGGTAGQEIHFDTVRGDWLLVPEVPHLGSQDPAYPSLQFPLVSGYARQHEIRLAAIFHDAMPLSHFGEEEGNGQNALAFMSYVLGLGACDAVLPVSRASSAALTALFARYGVAPRPDRMLVPALLPEEMIGKPKLAYLPKKPPAPDREIAFCMWGTIFPHKNYLAAMEAFNLVSSRLPDRDIKLHHLGSVSGACALGASRLVRHSGGRIKLHGFVSDDTLASIARSSRASIFISRAEGYGLPVSESLWLGLPCITSSVAPMTEIAAGGGAVLVDPASIDSIADAMEAFITDPALSTRLYDELKARSFRTWKEYGHDVLQLLRQAGDQVAPELRTDPELRFSFTPSPSHQATVGFEILAYDMSDMQTPPQYASSERPLVSDGILQYARDLHFDAPHDVICYGPYVSIGPGRYVLMFEGTMQGSCILQVTSDEGRKTHLNLEIDTLAVTPEFVIESRTDKLEILLIKKLDLISLTLETIYMTRHFV